MSSVNGLKCQYLRFQLNHIFYYKKVKFITLHYIERNGDFIMIINKAHLRHENE